jgi:hypothetical protein
MRYRAVLIDPGVVNPERPVQILDDVWQEIERWANLVLEKAVAADAFVNVWETREEKIKIIPRPQRPASGPTK